ncbi:MAG: hypothetical protein KKA42_01450 [candidate division Zixibacteria bacterium]|nr:hypothetical protein [candidate division Zixibacteria bacterium]
MGLDFIDRSLRTTGIVLLIFLPFGLYYFGVYPTIAVLSGTVWAMFNIMLLSKLIRSVIRPEGVENIGPVLVVLVLFVLLFAAGYFLLTIPQFDPMCLLIGFTGLFAIMFLKAVGRWLTNADEQSSNTRNIQKVL